MRAWTSGGGAGGGGTTGGNSHAAAGDRTKRGIFVKTNRSNERSPGFVAAKRNDAKCGVLSRLPALECNNLCAC